MGERVDHPCGNIITILFLDWLVSFHNLSEKYKILDQDRPYFVTFATVGWVDVFTRIAYKDIIVESLRYCQKEKGLVLHGWCLMSNHLHLIVGRRGAFKIEEIIRDFKKYTSVQLTKAIEANFAESRKEWMLDVFRKAAANSNKHVKYMFWQNEYHPIELSYNPNSGASVSLVPNN